MRLTGAQRARGRTPLQHARGGNTRVFGQQLVELAHVEGREGLRVSGVAVDGEVAMVDAEPLQARNGTPAPRATACTEMIARRSGSQASCQSAASSDARHSAARALAQSADADARRAAHSSASRLQGADAIARCDAQKRSMTDGSKGDAYPRAFRLRWRLPPMPRSHRVREGTTTGAWRSALACFLAAPLATGAVVAEDQDAAGVPVEEAVEAQCGRAAGRRVRALEVPQEGARRDIGHSRARHEDAGQQEPDLALDERAEGRLLLDHEHGPRCSRKAQRPARLAVRGRQPRHTGGERGRSWPYCCGASRCAHRTRLTSPGTAQMVVVPSVQRPPGRSWISIWPATRPFEAAVTFRQALDAWRWRSAATRLRRGANCVLQKASSYACRRLPHGRGSDVHVEADLFREAALPAAGSHLVAPSSVQASRSVCAAWPGASNILVGLTE